MPGRPSGPSLSDVCSIMLLGRGAWQLEHVRRPIAMLPEGHSAGCCQGTGGRTESIWYQRSGASSAGSGPVTQAEKSAGRARTGGVARLGLVTRRPLLQRPHVAVRIVEIRVEDPAHVVDVA